MSGMVDYTFDTSQGRVCDLPEQLRPRELMDRVGVENVPDDVLLAVLLRSGVSGANVLEVARRLVMDYGSLTGLAQASPEQLIEKSRGLGRVKVQVLMAALEIGRRLTEEKSPRRLKVKCPGDAASLLRPAIIALETEVFWAILLDSKNQVKGRPVDITHGLLDASLVHPREVFRPAIASSCAALIVAHNHPSGDPQPSAEDIRITRQLVEAGRVVDIKVLDHVIMGHRRESDKNDFVSMREDGLVDFA